MARWNSTVFDIFIKMDQIKFKSWHVTQVFEKNGMCRIKQKFYMMCKVIFSWLFVQYLKGTSRSIRLLWYLEVNVCFSISNHLCMSTLCPRDSDNLVVYSIPNIATKNITWYTCICLFVWGSFHSRIFHWFGDVTIAGEFEELQIFNYARHLWPSNSEGSLERHTYCDTGHSLIMVISEDPWQ